MLLLSMCDNLTFATVWSSLVYITPKESYGLAFATVVSVYNLFFTISSFLVGVMRRYYFNI
jgi:hypothetical protein